MPSKKMSATKNERDIRLTPLHYLTSALALALVCCSLQCLPVHTTPARASSGSQQVRGQTMGSQLAFDETETETPPPSATTTPSPTVTNTPAPTATTPVTPTPSPGVTPTTTPSLPPTQSATTIATTQPSPTATGIQTPSPAATPTSSATSITIGVQGTGAYRTPVASPALTNNQSDRASQGARQPDSTFPFSALMLGLGSVALLGLLLVLGWVIVRRRLLPVSLPKLPPSALAWSRTRISDAEEPTMQGSAMPHSSPFPPQGHTTSHVPSARTTATTAGSDTPPPVLNEPYLQSLIHLNSEERT